ncbi:uncharacterized protein EV420DRAFT_1474327 [Desarmillaria tabescens]|uniref:Uncharacterized protein n=1 Tax=Armillaria tabescens TaxID=1929756 RepID=A0AA39NJR5_ARMTA|nr:uncharacterized protein EV420DRAFT_1474327 [Desarmillaria tabescens]KAK0466914.1 hypothetical protein EV420DRAFT_1474327 [Desarmillaria tabescens]
MLSLSLVALALLAAVKADSWGPAYSLGPTSSAIIEASTTFTPGAPPITPKDALFLWIGISNSTSGLIQAGVDQLADNNAYCGASSTQWCATASYFGVVNGATTQLNGDLTPLDGDQSITIHYKADDNLTWDQVISTLQSYDGPLLNGGFGTGTECQSDCTGSTSVQKYTNTTIVLQSADPSFSSTLGKGTGVVASDMVTADGGKTWTIASIQIPAMV